MVQIDSLTPDFGQGIGTRARIGLIALATDHTIEDEFRTLIHGQGVAFFTTRVFNDPEVSPETLRAMAPRLSESAKTLLPGIPFDVIAYACTSASLLIGHDGVEKAVQGAHPEAKVATTMAAVAQALHRRQAKRIALVTPYIGAINEAMAAYLQQDGFEIAKAASFNEPDDNKVARLSAETIWAAIKELGQGEGVDAVFVSCTNIRTLGHIHEWESELGKPVVSSNIALAESCLSLADLRA